MELKEYQKKSLEQVKRYLELLNEWREKAEHNPELEIDFPAKAWEKAEIGRQYRPRKNGLGEPLPNFCLKIPTGGGKTLLAVKSIDIINSIYRKKRTGLILWIVPTNQIYRQTIQNLRNRDHPYRQHLDIASGGHTLILEKTDHFTPLDIEENIVIMMLMLPSASRQNKETLRMFRDSGGFQDFFPSEDNIESHRKLLAQLPNLDTFGGENGFWGRQVKTSLGNTLRLLSPIIILDEGHKAYSETAQKTLHGFNPSLILELSATPSELSNILVDIRGVELNREEMIKLDIHIFNNANPDWKDTLLKSIERRNLLEETAKEYESNTGVNIRPICIIQAERTGKEQRGKGYIHSEDVRDYLTKIAGIPSDQVAVTSAELKEIEGVDLLDKNCPIRYIITKQALQEGWDCAFAYLLTILTNPTSKNALTQLVGRILRQPLARKTKIKEIDESYVFAFQQRTTGLLASIKRGFEQEGLGDVSGHIVTDGTAESGEITYSVRKKFREAAGKIVLPVFVVKDRKSWRTVNYEMDIESRIPWKETDLEPIFSLSLSRTEERNIEVTVGLSEGEKLIQQTGIMKTREGGIRLDSVFLARHLLDTVRNPWIAHEIGETVISRLLRKHDETLVANNFVFIIEELRKHLAQEKDRLAKKVFQDLMSSGILRFMVIGKDFGFRLPKEKTVKKTAVTLTRRDGQQLQRYLHEFVPEEEFNELEKSVAWYLEEQERLFFWYRNIDKSDYSIQGWKKQKIYPDFIFTKSDGKQTNDLEVFVVETKGLHLKNEDTSYKQSVFSVCNRAATKRNWKDVEPSLREVVRFEVVFEDEWKNKLNELIFSQK